LHDYQAVNAKAVNKIQKQVSQMIAREQELTPDELDQDFPTRNKIGKPIGVWHSNVPFQASERTDQFCRSWRYACKHCGALVMQLNPDSDDFIDTLGYSECGPEHSSQPHIPSAHPERCNMGRLHAVWDEVSTS